MPASSRCITVNTNHTDSKTCLFSVSFTNGELESSKYADITTKVYQQKKSERIRKLVVGAGDMDYAGDYDSQTIDFEGKYVGVEDPDTMEMTLVPLKRVKLRPAISLSQEGEPDDEERPQKTKQEQHDNLIEAFGGAKQKQNLMRRKKHGINKEMIYDALDSAGVESIPVFITPSTPSGGGGNELLPPYNTETTDPHECYPLDGYFPESIRNDLEGFVDDVCVDNDTLTEWRKSNRYPNFVITQLEQLPLAEYQKKNSAVLIKYLLFLIRLYQLRAPDLKAQDPISSDDKHGIYEMPGSCLRHLLDTYTVKAGRHRSIPGRLKDKILVGILLVALRLERNSITTNELLSDIKVGANKLATIAKVMGCKAKIDKRKESPEVLIELYAPLKFPEGLNTVRARKK